jgi:hypothetical protein
MLDVAHVSIDQYSCLRDALGLSCCREMPHEVDEDDVAPAEATLSRFMTLPQSGYVVRLRALYKGRY